MPEGNFNLIANPPGCVCHFAVQNPPEGWLECDGSDISKSTYANLFNVIGDTFGTATDTTNNFKLPDFRGQFIRSWNRTSSGKDSDRVFGSHQDESFKSHNHSINDPQHQHGTYAADDGGRMDGSTSQSALTAGHWQGGYPTQVAATGITINNEGGEETRPTNYALLVCIKY
tara:strand:- start:1233 stop:1748 length:516 start_codon:yes stop_codon:yes gene_type:complete